MGRGGMENGMDENTVGLFLGIGSFGYRVRIDGDQSARESTNCDDPSRS
jgi:hypothetical protein